MSRVNLFLFAVSSVALCSLSGCASSAMPSTEQAELDAQQQAIEEALRPATAEQIAAAERSDPLTRANFWAGEYRKNSGELNTIVAFMHALRAIGSHERVEEIATAQIPVHPDSYELPLEYGRSLLADKKPSEAIQVFLRSADLAPPDVATPLAALGVAFDQVEEHANAQKAYAYALAREPGRVSTLSNYGLSLALSGNLSEAELQLRKAASLPGANTTVKQNLALILGLQGRFEEMAEVDPNAPRRTVEANRRALKDMMIPARDYSTLRQDAMPMPQIDDGDMTEETMTDIVPQTAQTEPSPSLSGAAENAAPLRPKLRGSQTG